MSSTPVQELPTQGLSSDSEQTLPSRPLQPSSDPSASKRVCFYKSGDYQFGGHRMVINARTFKTFDALLDALSKKVPLPFGVRTITTPRGTHLVRALDDLVDGGAYVCSDQKRVKPLNLDEVNRRQVPWNTTRPLNVGRRRRQGLRFGQSGSRNEATIRPAKVTERVAVRTPKKLMVIKNRDPSVKHTIVLQRRTAPTFDALLDYMSQILQFPVLKLYSTDGRRVDGLAALILCSGVVVAAGNEPFRLANYSFHRRGQMAQAMYVETAEPSMLQLRTQKKKSFSSGRGSRNFSVSSERYIVNQINRSQNGHPHPQNGSSETEANQHHTSVETSGTGRADNVHQTCIVPNDDDIEKSFRVNQDGSMTVEMKVRLTIKEEEMLHWTTTLSRSSLSKRTACASISESGNRSPDSNNAIAKDSSSISEEETKEENYPPGAGKGVGFNDERTCEGYTSTATGKAKKSVRRTSTPGPRHVKKASIESVKRVTESGVQESTLGHYSYVERTADGETTEGYCVVRHSSSSSRPIPKPRKTVSAGASKKCSIASIRSSGVAEVLQIENNGMEFTETVMHIYETQGSYDNYFANQEYSVDGIPLHGSPSAPESKQSTDSGPQSSSNDCDIDCSWQPPTADSLQRQKEEMLSLSSEPVSLTHDNTNNLSSPSENETQRNLQIQGRVKVDDTPKSMKKKKMTGPARSHKSSASTSSKDRKLKENLISPPGNSKNSSTDKLSSQASVGKRSLNSSESAKRGQKSKGTAKKAESPQSKKSSKDEKTPRKNSTSLVRTEDLKRTQRQNTNKAAASDNGHNVNTPTGRPQMKKNMSDILQPNKSLLLGKKKSSKSKSMSDSGISQAKTSFLMPSLDPSPSEIHQYVENWLEKVSPDQVLYPEEAITEATQPQTKVVFQIGGDSESDETNEYQTNLHEDYPSPDDVIKKSTSCLSVPLSHEELAAAQGLSVSMPNVRAELVHQENRMRSHKSAEAIGPADDSSSSNFLSPKVKIKPALQQLCSSIQCIRRASDANVTSNLEKSSSLPDFPTHVASVFGSSCKAFLSFLSVMTLRDHLTGYTPGEGNKSSSTSEAMLMMESLQKISAIEDEEEQRASLTDLQSRSSSRLRQSWKDFQILRERLESEPLSPKVSETEFALDVVSEGGDAFDEHNLGIDELMDELSMPQDLREEIASTIKTFYPVEESQCVETDRNQSESEEDVEQFVQESNDEMKQPDSDSRCVTEDTSEDTCEIKHGHDGAVYTQQGKIMSQSDQHGEAEKSQTEKEEFLKDKENETKEDESRQEGKLEEVEEVKIREYGDTKETEAHSEGTQKEDRESKEEAEEEPEQAKSGEVTDEESIDNQEADEEAETKEEDSRKEEQLEEEEEVKIREYGNTKETEAVSEGSERGDQESEEEGEPEQSKSVEVSAVESIDNEKAGADEEEETKEEESRKEEQLEEVEKEKIREYGNTKETEAVSERTEKEDREKEEEGEEVPEQSESEEMSGEESMNKEKAGADEEEDETEEEEEEMTLDEKELGVELEEGEKAEADETEEAFMNEDSTQYSAEETDEREGAEETEEEEEVNEKVDWEGEKESSDEGEIEDRQEEKEDAGENMEQINEGEEEENVAEEVEQEEEEDEDEDEDEEEEEEEEEEVNGELHSVPRDVEEEVEEGTEVSDNEKKEIGNITESDEVEEVEAETSAVTDAEEEVTEKADEDMEMEDVTEDISEQEAEEEEETEQNEEVGEGKHEEEEGVEEEREQEREFEEEGSGESVVKNTEEKSMRIITDEEEVDEGRETDIEDEKYDEAEDSRKELEQTESNQEEESAEERECVDELEMNENLTGQIGDEEEMEDDEEKESQEKLDQEETQGTGSQSKYSSEGQCADDKGNGTDTVTETDEGGETLNERNGNLSHPVEISQELLDFVNYALQSSSLIFIYDTEGNIRIEPDNAQVVQIKQTIIPKSRKDSSYGSKRLPSPSTSDLSDYRPGTSESGGYQTQDSVDIMSESGEEASEKPSQVYTHPADRTERTNVELINSKLSVASNSETFHSFSVSSTKASREDLSYFRSASSLKADAAANTQATQCISFVSENSADGVLIDQGRWLLKENHLIRKSPPVSLGMYSNLDSTSLDTGQENTSDDSPPHFKTQHSPLVAISSSELEELAKPPTPKCIYYNMPHGSDSDPFLDDCSVRSSARGRGVKVSPTIDTSKTWANKNGSQSSFASVEFRIPDRKVHPGEEPAVVTQPRRTSGGDDHVLQSQNSVDNLRLRCGQYCPIL